MLISQIRRKSKGFIAYFIIGLISLTFVIVAFSGLVTAPSTIIVAKVDGVEISKDTFSALYNAQKRNYQEQLGENYNPEFDTRLKKSVILNLVNQKMLESLSEQLDYVTTDKELQTSIKADKAFAKDGVFDLEKYQQLLRLNGYSTAKYEANRQQQLTQNQIKSNFSDTAFITPSALKRIQALNSQQRQFDYIKLEADNYLDQIKIKAKQVEDFYKDKKETFFEAAKVKVDFVELSLDAIAKKIKPSQAELQNFYEDEQQRFSTEGERKAQHILVADEKLAKKVSALLAKDGDFAKLAAEYSTDTGSKDRAGDLGFFTKGVMVPAFENTVFGMEVGQISAPIKSEFGYHIIKLNAIKAQETKPFDAVQTELIDLFSKKQAQKSLYNLTEQLANLAYEASLEEIAEQMTLKLNSTPFFAQKNTDYDPAFVKAAFSDVVLNKGETSSVIELKQDRFVVMRLNQQQAQRQKSFTEAKAEISTYLSELEAKIVIDNIANKIITAFNADKAKKAQDLINQNKLKWQPVGWVSRDSKKADATLINKVFSLSKPAGGKAIYGVQNLAKDSVAIIRLSDSRVGELNDKLEQSLLGFESNEMFNSVLESLKSKAEIKIFGGRL